MGPKPTPNKQSTLFSFFSKSPAASNKQDVLSPKRSPNQGKESSQNNKTKILKEVGSEYVAGDLLWSKLESFPWWPGLVCKHPTDNTHYKGGKLPKIHVQFFDDPVSRAWIKAKNMRPFEGSDVKDCERGGAFYSTSPAVEKGATEADKALKMSREERLTLVVDLQPSEDEDDKDEEMDFDPDIFDAEMSDEDGSKENLAGDGNDKLAPKKTPSKSPGKQRRPQRAKAKRRRIVVQDSDPEDSEDEFKLEGSEEGSGEDDGSSGVDENDVTSDSASEAGSPLKLPAKRKRKEIKPSRGPKTARKPIIPDKPSSPPSSVKKSLGSFSKGDGGPDVASPHVSTATKSKLAAFTAADTVGVGGDTEEKTDYQHTKYEWLRPDKIRDADKHLRSDPNYNPRTLYIPDQDKFKFTPAMRQWWEIKTQHFDTVLFFKMGKFYELFHMDAAIAVTELGLIYMKGDYAHSGFPEIAYGRYADTLVKKGYKVARIEQTETPDMMEKRCKSMTKAPTKYDKVVKREVCRIQTKGTKTFSFLAGECSDSQSTYLLAIAEKECDQDGCSMYGVCFVDTSIGKFHIGQFTDDRHCSRLRTLLAHYPPVQILHERGKLSSRTLTLISTCLSSVIKEALTPRTEFWESGKTLRVLAEETYFKSEGEKIVWPDALKAMMSDSDALGRSASEEYTLAVSSLGALLWYLRYCLLDEELLSMQNFDLYKPLDGQNMGTANVIPATLTSDLVNKHMVLDGVTLSNLDVTENSCTGTLEGTLLEQLDQCHTPFGKRLLRHWVCAPLCNPASINDRLDAIGDLHGCQDVVATVTEILKKLPDLERLLSRIHTLGTAKSSRHPDTRAILYEDVTYSKRKIEDFLATLGGFKEAMQIARKFKDVTGDFKSKLLRKTVSVAGTGDGYFPDLKEELMFFDHAFDHNKAKKDGVIVPSTGVDEDYDGAVDDMKRTTRGLDQYLDRQRTRLGCRSIVYWGTGKNRFQMEVPDSAGKKVPDEYELMSSKKGTKRYRTTEIEDLLANMTEAEDRKDTALKDVMRRIFHNFDKRYKQWDMTVQCLSVLDVLLSLAQYSRCSEGAICRPEIVSPDVATKPFMEIREARHPCICRTFSGGDFIPNDTVIGIADENDMETDEATPTSSDSRVVLVTGPNMGGKSTLMRQVGLITIIAQMGCYVPAERCRLTPVDRVFTRLGASDRIMAGESTFFVELSETSAILQHATQHSLVLVDELGRGTATYDGTAIACSVVQELSRNIQCRTLFSTHYHSLVEEFSHDPNIRLGHMACMVENEDDEDPTQETITFLYKFVRGACPKSYGFNAARLANLPEDVIKVAVHKARAFEESQDKMRLFKGLWKDSSPSNFASLQQGIPV